MIISAKSKLLRLAYRLYEVGLSKEACVCFGLSKQAKGSPIKADPYNAMSDAMSTLSQFEECDHNDFVECAMCKGGI